MNTINLEQERNRALLFLDRKTIVHISKIDGFFSNGILLEVGSDFFIIKDRVDGGERLIFFSELKNSIEIYREREE
jgi:hypothetical protein